MKILTISNCPLIESQGSGYIIVNCTRGLQRKGHEVDIFEPNDYEPLQFLQGHAKQYRQALGMFFFCLFQINKKKYDIIEFYGAESWLIVLFLSKFKVQHLLILSHSNGLETHAYKVLSKSKEVLESKKWYQTSLFERCFKKVDGIVTLSDYDRSYGLRHQYQQEENITTVEPSLLSTFLGLQLNFSRDQVIGYCGTWILRKGTKIIVNDISKILVEFPQCIFKLVGVGNNFKKEEYFPVEVCNRVEVIPFVDSKDQLKTIYQTISIFIMPSIYESFGLVSAEAMACGCALVSNKTGFAASLKHREDAMLIDDLTSPHLYEATKELLINESLRIKISQAGYEKVQNLRWDLTIDKLEMTYLQWLDKFRNKSQETKKTF